MYSTRKVLLTVFSFFALVYGFSALLIEICEVKFTLFQDGAGRVGKMLFARQGKKFDYDLKQVKFIINCCSTQFGCKFKLDISQLITASG